jgi:CobQ-like glutamine amidotransferase family enzyme
MKEIKILHLFPKLLSLYGEYGNVAVLANELRKVGFTVTVDSWEKGELNLAYDFIYIGSGTEDNLSEAVKRLLPHAEAIKASTETTSWLATGNAMTLFGKTICRGDSSCPALNVFDYTSTIHNGKRYLGDALTAEDMIGFINTSSVYEGVHTPLFCLLLNPKLGNDKASAADGIHVGKFYGTQLIGPVLVKNPHFMEQIAAEITGEPLRLSSDSNIRKAYDISLNELKKRLQ